jgi:hypothetical protein
MRITVQHFLALAGLAFGVTGGFILALADVWFSHAVLADFKILFFNDLIHRSSPACQCQQRTDGAA